MYVTRQELPVPTTRAVELQRQNDRRVDVLKTQRGFLGSLLLNSLGYPVMHVSPMYYPNTKYVLLTQWESVEAADIAVCSSEWQSFVQRHPSERLFTPTHPVADYEVVHHLTAPGEARFAWLVDFDTNPSPEEATFQASAITALSGLYKERLGPFVESRLLKQLRDPNRFLTVLLLKRETEFPPGQDSPEIRELLQAYLPNDHSKSRLIPEGFQVVHHI